MDNKEVVEMEHTTKCYLIDGLAYTEDKRVLRIGAATTLGDLRAFEMIEVDTGFDDEPRIMAILPKRSTGVAALIGAALMLMGCGSGASYHWSYSCYGQGCAPPQPPSVGYMYWSQPARVHAYSSPVYVDRPVEVRVLHDGRIDTSNFNRRAASPQWRKR